MTSEKAYDIEQRLNALIAGGTSGLTSFVLPGGVSQHITSTSDALITGLICPVAAGTYRFRGIIFCTQGSANPGAVIACSPHGPAASAYVCGLYYFQNTGGSISSRTASTIGTGNSSSASIPVNAAFHCLYEGVATFTAAGNLSIQASEATSGVDFTVGSGSFLDIWQVT